LPAERITIAKRRRRLREVSRNYRLGSFSLWLFFVLLGPGAAAQVSTMTEPATPNGVFRTAIKADGTYELEFSGVDWHLAGRLPEVPESIQSTSGKDEMGSFDAVSATYRGGARTAQIRIYRALPIAIFRDVWNSPGANERPFPAFDHLPAGLMRFSYQRKTFGTYQFGTLGPEGPWSLFDKLGNVIMLSPADNFLISRMNESPGGAAESGIVQAIATLPAGFSHSTLLVFDKGMNQAFSVWGSALLALGGKQRPANDANVVLAKLGYWTDNGARYYYKFDPPLGYAGTLLAVRDQFKKLGVPLGYLQLDSWWYPKGVNARWNSASSALPDGESTYRADKELFPDGLAAFQQSLGLPLVTHARWISTASPYRTEYKMSGNVVLDPAFWKSTSDYLADAGVVTYEQDWLDHNAQTERNLQDPQSFLENMSQAMRGKGISIQYCMPLPSHYMASTQYANVQTIRTSTDRFDRDNWDSFLYDSRLAAAVGLWPWTDVFYSDELPNLILSTLSAGPVGVGDALGETNAHNLSAAVRADGLIVKPDSPLLPIDSMYTSEATDQSAPMVATAQSGFGNQGARYVFAYARSRSQEGVTVALGDLKMSGPVFAYDWMTHSAVLVPEAGSIRMQFTGGWDYQILSPVNRQGLALLGDTEKIATLGKQRIAASEDHGTLTATIKFAPAESRLTISGYASHRPKLRALQGKLQDTSYDPQTKIFRAQIMPAGSGEAVLQVRPR
jgi:hypothetical protein